MSPLNAEKGIAFLNGHVKKFKGALDQIKKKIPDAIYPHVDDACNQIRSSSGHTLEPETCFGLLLFALLCLISAIMGALGYLPVFLAMGGLASTIHNSLLALSSKHYPFTMDLLVYFVLAMGNRILMKSPLERVFSHIPFLGVARYAFLFACSMPQTGLALKTYTLCFSPLMRTLTATSTAAAATPSSPGEEASFPEPPQDTPAPRPTTHACFHVKSVTSAKVCEDGQYLVALSCNSSAKLASNKLSHSNGKDTLSVDEKLTVSLDSPLYTSRLELQVLKLDPNTGEHVEVAFSTEALSTLKQGGALNTCPLMKDSEVVGSWQCEFSATQV